MQDSMVGRRRGQAQLGLPRSPVILVIFELLAYWLFVTAAVQGLNHVWGNPIECATKSTTDKASNKIIKSHCWMSGLYTDPNAHQRHAENLRDPTKTSGLSTKKVSKETGIDQPDPGRVYHNYYKFIPFLTLLLGMSFLVPGILWNIFQDFKYNRLLYLGGYLDIAGNLREPSIDSKKLLAREMRKEASHLKLNAVWELLIRLFAGAILVGQIYGLQSIFDGNWLRFGIASITRSKVFPKFANCLFEETGQHSRVAALCALNVHVLNEGIYLAVWYAQAICAVILISKILVILALAVSQRLRVRVMYWTRLDDGFNDLKTCLTGTGFNYWVFMDRLADCLGPGEFKDLIKLMNAEGQGKKRN